VDTADQRILAHMQRAPSGQYTTAQLARNTGLSLAEVERCLAQLDDAGIVVRSSATSYPAYHLTEQGTAQPSPRRAGERSA